MQPETVPKEPIAVIGLGCVLPDAPDVESFWKNITEGRSSVREVPAGRWDPTLFWDADRDRPDKTYAKIGAFVADDAFNPLDYRMPPKVVEQIDPSQRWALSATRQAFRDAGYRSGLKGDDGRDFDRTRCAVILGNAMGGELMKLHTKRLYWPQVERALRTDASFQTLAPAEQESILRRTETTYKADVPPVTEDSMPGTLSNVAAGRIANVFDLSGKNFTTDAACASSLAALDSAIDTLRKGEADVVVWGGTDRSMDVTPYVEFSKIGALSADGSRPFDKDANGFVMGEGCVVLLLKRLSDAERDGDKVYGVVRGVGGSSDGKGKGITAPNPVGQVKAVHRAYTDAGVDPFTLGYLEAHGTSTPVGDPVELAAAEEAFRALSPTQVRPGSIAVGSVKSNMGHLKSAAGAVGLLKAVLALKRGVLPPSINVRTLNPAIDWGRSPFRVQTRLEPWPRPEGHPRRAAVSSFGFGGTNFHVVLEEHVPGHLRTSAAGQQATAQGQLAPGSGGHAVAAAPALDLSAFQAHMREAAALEAEPVVLDATTAAQAAALAPARFHETGEGPRLRDALHPLTAKGIAAPVRVGLAVAGAEEVGRKLALAQKAATDRAQARLAFNQGVFLGQGPVQGKVAFLFPGQGTQYVNMMRDLARKYEVVRNTFEEADQVLFSELDGVKLTDILWPTPDTPQAQAAAEEKLKLTEFTQPAVLAADVAMLRLLRQWGVQPHVVAGHSLGEYGALVAAGVLSFADALHAVAARGREMAHVEVPDLGKMASVSADWHQVSLAIGTMQEYVIPANKNCPSQTVIAGTSKGVDEAVRLLQEKGLQVQVLPVSAAFHSKIVAPASKPLRNVLARLDVKPPQVRVLSNVGAEPYPDDPEAIRDNLAVQVASPVEWIGIVERMYGEGVRVFVEVGPKKALTGFVQDVLKDRADAVAICSNHPKKGGIAHANELFAFLGAWGFQPRLPALDDPAVYTASFRDPAAPFRRATAAPAPAGQPSASPAGLPDRAFLERLASDLQRVLAQPAVVAPAARPADLVAPSGPSAGEAELRRRLEAFGICLDDVAISGISIGLPGTGHELFADDNWDRILRGENLIDALPEAERAKLADKNIQRLVKGSDGSARFQSVSDIAQVIQLAGRRGGFDLAQWGVDKDLIESLDRTFQYAIAAGLEALRDAGIPLVRTYGATSQGTWLPKEWKLPEPLRDETGVIFASAFPGYDNFVRDVSRYLADKYAGRSLDELQALYGELIGVVQDDAAKARLQDAFDREFARLQDVLPGHGAARYEFNRKFLFNVLSMGHSQLAQLIGARGPNTQVNAACASSTQAIAIAEDCIRTGRARRVLVVGSDDVTSDALFEWIGAGFLASGAATTKSDIKEAALPFDRRRHGMIVGMGAVGIVVEAEPEVAARGMRPIARLLASKVSNSAFHGSRLDVAHIAEEMRTLVATAGRRYGLTPEGMAAQTVFMSHETYTPARGGSASAEVHALRATFGAHANKVVVANTKGFTGHPQGAGIEDAIVLKCLQRGRLPPIANFRDPDPELGDLNLSRGGEYANIRYALRLAAGFGSQVAMTLTELVAKESERVADPGGHQAWLERVSGIAGARTEVRNRTLRVVDVGPPKAKPRVIAEPPAKPLVPAVVPAAAAPSVASAPSAVPSAAPAAADGGKVLEKLLALVGEKTGYPRELLDPDLDMEADLGIDTVKQAELFGAIRDLYALPQEEGIQIKDYPTLRKVAGYVASRLDGSAAPAPTPAQPQMAQMTQTESAAPSPSASAGGADQAQVLERLIGMVGERTGYPRELLDPNLDMESDLGIDTVKQAELFGAIRDAYKLPPEEGMQIKDYPTLGKVAGYVVSRLGGSAAPAPAPAQPQMTQTAQMVEPQSAESATSAARPEAAATGNLAPDAVLAEVTRLVAAKTGYPADMLLPDLDMEADLGIDTVKQAELFGEVRAQFGIAPVDGMLLKDYPTLRRVAGFVLDHAGAASPPTKPQIAQSAETPSVESVVPSAPPAPSRPASESILRRVPSVRPQERPGSGPALARGTVLVVGDADQPFVDALRQAGFAPTFHPKDGEAVTGILALGTRAGLAPEQRVGPLFDAAKAHRASLGSAAFVCSVTRQDGAHGLRLVRDASMAALTGLAKALRKELPEALVKAIDVHPDCADAPQQVVQELLRGGTRTEVAYDATGRRFVVEVAPEDLPPATPDVAGKGLVVSGGAQGITVEMLAALAPQGPRLLLLGRTPQPGEAADWARLDAAGWKAVEQAAMEAIKARGEKVTPVAVQREVDPMRKAADVHRNLNRLQAAGAQVLYAPVDVTDAASVAEAVAWARGMWGRIDGVVHAAGVEVSKDLASKDRKQFDAVFAVKAQGWRALMEATKADDLTVLAAFGSVAGRFGNVGQADYSAANEWLTKAVKEEAARRRVPTAFTVSWGPWGEVGMATKGSILQIMHASGVTPIPTEEGVGWFLRELATPGVRESVVAGQLGAIDADGQAVDSGWDPRTDAVLQEMERHPDRFRLVASIDAFVPGSSAQATLRMDQARDPYARDHRVDGVPYLPGVFGIEAFAQVASLLAPDGTELHGAQDVRFALPLKQLKAAPATGTIECRVAEADGMGASIACRLTSRFVGPDGKAHGEPKVHFEATLTYGPRQGAPRAELESPEWRLRRDGIYPPFFHGPSFQVLDAAGPGEGAMVARVRGGLEPAFAGGAASHRTHPLLSEAIFQACGLWAMLREQSMCLPAGIERLEVFQPGAHPEGVRVRGVPTGRNADGTRRFDGEAVDAQGRVVVRMTGFAMVETGPAPVARLAEPPLGSPESPAAGTTVAPQAPSGSPSGASLSVSGDTQSAQAQLGRTEAPAIPAAAVALPQSDEVHFAAVQVTQDPAPPEWFTEAERAKHASFPVPKRANDWRAGRLAVKKAVVETHPGLLPLDVEVAADEASGRPRLVVNGQESALWVSITHRGDLAVAAVSPAPLGIDLETFEDRSRSFLEEAFGVGELKALLEAEDPKFDAACMWAAKEAALKRAGIGLKADLRAHHVSADGKGGALVEGPAGRFGIRFYDLGGRVLAVSAPHHDPDVRASAGSR